MENIRHPKEGEPQDIQRGLAPLEESRDERVIRLGIEQALAEGRAIDDYTARYIAAQLHGGQVSALYSLASTGNIDSAVFTELEADRESFEPHVQGWVDALHGYCQARPSKGPVEGWMRRASEQEHAEDEASGHRDVLAQSPAAGVTTLGQAAVARSNERGKADHDAPDHEDDGPDTFPWDDASSWSPGDPVAEQISERRCTSQELDELFGEQPDEQVGSVDELGWHGLVRHEGRTGGLVLTQDAQGFRSVREAESDQALAQAWTRIQSEYERFCEERDAYERATEEAERAAFDGLRIWVGSLADYVAGRLHGVWMDATCEAEELQAAIRFMLRGSHEEIAEEWGIFDHEGFHGYRLGEYASLSTVSRIAQGIAEHGEAYAKWVEFIGTERDELLSDESFNDHYLGRFDSTEAYIENLLEECEDYEYLEQLPEHLKPYVKIDTEMMARDYESELYVVEEEGGGLFVFDMRG